MSIGRAIVNYGKNETESFNAEIGQPIGEPQALNTLGLARA